MNIYKEELIDHYRYPRNRATLEKPDFCSGEFNPSCGDSVQMAGMIQDQKLLKLVFTGSGCVISQATASMLTDYCKGKLLVDVLAFDQEKVVALIGMQLGFTRLKCALLPLIALQTGIKQYQQQ